MQQRIKVLMAGPDLKEQGGMGSVQQHIVNHIQPYADLKHISTWDGSNGVPSMQKKVSVFTQAVLSFLWTLLTEHVDVVHLHISERGSIVRSFVLMLLAKIFRKPVLLHAHGCEFHVFHDELPPFLKKVVNWGIQNSFLISLSDSWYDWYEKHCGMKPSQGFALKNPVEFPQNIERQTVGAQGMEFLFLGKLDQRKGIFDILQAFAQLGPNLQKQIKLTFAGSGNADELLQIAQELEIDQQVSLTGWVNPEQRDQLLLSSDVFLLPSYNEGLPMSLLEAMAWGLPAVTTPVGGIPEVIKDHYNGILIEPGNLKQLTEAMALLATQPKLRKKFGDEARETMRPLSVDRYISSLLEIYHEITNTRSTLTAGVSPAKDKALNV